MTDGHENTHFTQAENVCTLANITALDRVAQGMQDLCNATHANAADTDEVNDAKI